MARSKRFDPMDEEPVKGDMTPMIDIIFLLLIFFLLTTRFIVPEKMISQLLPTNKGQASSSPPVVEPPPDLNILIYPEGFARGMGVQQMDDMWKANPDASRALLQVGNNDPIMIEGSSISASTRQASLEPVLEGVFQYIAGHLAAAEDPGESRDDQRPVVIHCFSALSWKYALLAYDAVRQYERDVAGSGAIESSQDLREAREVSFAPPRIRNYHTWELGNELWEILHMR
ncbi:MAG: hypothetical protein EA401_13680 [Planctomycetota bacterium]|nr:MAG: hypothetical protein EA401_13680 [Planctomycetota bacterium]